MKDVRLRFAPSPTGYLHIGGLRTILYNYLYAKQKGGKLVLRIEDTDQVRLVEGAIENLIKSLDWSNIEYDEGVYLDSEENIYQEGDYGPYIQSERLDTYKKYVDQLLDSGHAYYCFCTKDRLDELRESQKIKGQITKYDGLCRGVSREEAKERIANGEPYVVRLKMPSNYEIKFNDLVRGPISFNSDDQDDQVLLKTDGYPTYHMAVVVDDHLMKISHVVRGEEWISSTPKHVYTFEALGWDAPVFVHLPTVLNKDRQKLSKRDGDVSVHEYKEAGYLPEGLVNYLALVGWSPSEHKEILTMEELIDDFSFERVSRSGGVFDLDKLNWVNAHYMKKLDIDELYRLSKPFIIDSKLADEEFLEENIEWIKFLLQTVQNSVDNLAEIPEAIEFAFVGYPDDLEDGAKEVLKGETVPDLIEELEKQIKSVEKLDLESAQTIIKSVQKNTGLKGRNLFMPIRVAISGVQSGPELPNIMYIINKEGLLENIEKAKQYL